MNRVWEANSAVAAPSYPGSPSVGHPTDGNLMTSTPATNPGAWWFHMITEEIMAVLAAAGIAADGTLTNQLLAALDARYASGGTAVHIADFTGSNQSLATSGYQKLPGGLILQWGQVTISPHATATFTFPIAFPTACLNIQANLVNSPYTDPTESIPTVLSNSASSAVIGNYWSGDAAGTVLTITGAILAVGY